MATRKMHADELEIDAGLVGRLLAAQFPQWADRPIERVPSGGTDNALCRLGGDPVARLRGLARPSAASRRSCACCRCSPRSYR
jgi:aminoglycoside phosphotransferase (APT) family kinase protein